MPQERRPAQVERALAALRAAAAELEALAERAWAGDEAEIIETGVLMARDPVLVDDVEASRARRAAGAAAALEAAAAATPRRSPRSTTRLLAARAEDVRSLGRRAARLAGAATGSAPRWPGRCGDVILVADELGPADVAELGPEVVGIALAAGGPTAHAAIVARGARAAARGRARRRSCCCRRRARGSSSTGERGPWCCRPRPPALDAAAAAQEAARRPSARRGSPTARCPPSRSTDTPCGCSSTPPSAAELDAGLDAGAEGVGLLRTELAFLEAETWPTEAQHRAALAPVLRGLAGRTATVRVLDFGGDKTPPFLAGTRERGLELLLAHPDALDAQLRAIVDAGRDTELRDPAADGRDRRAGARASGRACPRGASASAR